MEDAGKIKYFQDAWPYGTCFGCGPANPDGLQIKSRWSDDGRFVIAEYIPDPKHNSGMPDIMYGGTVASLIDCHSIWTAMAFAHKEKKLTIEKDIKIAYVTAKLTVEYLKPTPLSRTIFLKAWVEGETGKKARVICELGTKDIMTAKGDLLAVMIN